MKIIFSSLITLCVFSAASAQVKPDALFNKLKCLTPATALLDSSLSKLTLQQTGLTPGNYFKSDLYRASNYRGFMDGNANTIVSNMPVKSMQSNDRMGVAVLGDNNQAMLIKRVVVVKPLATAK